MLKLNYTEVGLHMERSQSAPELLIAQHVVLAMRLGQTLWVEPGHAAFLLPVNVPELVQLEQDCSPLAMVLPVDDEFVEVRLSGSWIAQSQAAHEGMFLSVMAAQTERLLYRLWQMSKAKLPTLA